MDRPSHLIRVGLLGASTVATYAMIGPARRNGAMHVTAVAARDVSRAEAFARRHGIASIARSYQALIDRDDIDLVYIGLPPALHVHWALQSLSAGKAVLCEKPLAIDAAEARTAVHHAAAVGCPLIEAFHYRFHATMARALDVVATELGALRSMQAVVTGPGPADASDVRWQAGLGGGALLDLGCYAVHALRTLAGGEPLVQRARHTLRGGVDVTTDAWLSFDRCGEASIRCSFEAARFTNSLHIVGDAGSLDIEGFMLPQEGGRFRLMRGGQTHEEALPTGSTYDAQFVHVAAVLRGELVPLTGGLDAIGNAQALEAIRLAARRS